MPDLNRNKIRQILKYLEDTKEINYRHVRRVLEDPRAILKGGLDTKEERRFGNVIRVQEQKEFFALLAKKAKLSGRARQQFDWAVHPRNIGTTLRRAQEHTKPKPEKKKARSTPSTSLGTRSSGQEEPKGKDGDDDQKEPPAPRGFIRTMLGL